MVSSTPILVIWLSNIFKKADFAMSFIKETIRIDFSVKYNANTSSLFDETKITKVENIYEKPSL